MKFMVAQLAINMTNTTKIKKHPQKSIYIINQFFNGGFTRQIDYRKVSKYAERQAPLQCRNEAILIRIKNKNINKREHEAQTEYDNKINSYLDFQAETPVRLILKPAVHCSIQSVTHKGMQLRVYVTDMS